MLRIVSRFARVALLPMTVVLAAVTHESRAATLTRYSSAGAFLESVGSAELVLEDFERFTSSAIVIDDQISGVVLSSPNEIYRGEGYEEIHVISHSTATSGTRILVGGSVPGVESPYLQILVLDFSPGITAFSFYLTAYNPEATPASVRFEFLDDPSITESLSNLTGSESSPAFFGAIADTAIQRVTITSGTELGVFEEFGIDDLRFSGAVSEEDTTPPICTGAPSSESDVLGIDGTADDSSRFEDFQTGIASVELEPGSSNVSLTVESFEAGEASVSFRVEPIDPSVDAQGTVIATDGGGNTCTVPATFRALGAGPLTSETICSAEGLLFSISNDSETEAGASACSANLPNADEPPFPPGYEATQDEFPCRVFTIESPISGTTDMVLKKDGDFDERLRMLFSESTDGGVTFPAFEDVTLSVEEIANITPDPTRIIGSTQWTPVKVACAIQSESARVSFCAGAGAPGPDADTDGYSLCASTPDCNDQRAFIYPGAPELCNGLDDNCDGARDEGSPTEEAGRSCTVIQDSPGHPPLLGACLQGETSCENGPMTCEQTVTPVQEIACNGIDDDCDGSADEAYVFAGYQAPIKPAGAVTVFLKKRGAIPVKFQLRDCAGRAVTSAVATIEVRFVEHGVIGDDAIDISSVGQANTDDFYRVSGSQYVYNLNASFLQSNSFYVIRTHLDDGTFYDVTIGIK